MVCIGGSTTHGGNRVETDQTYPYYIEELVNKAADKPLIEVLNSGIPGKPTEYHRDFVRQRIGDQELDILLIHSLYNHFSSFYPYSFNPAIDKIFIDRNSRVRTVYRWDKMNPVEIANVFLMEHSFFYTRLREKMLRLGRKDINAFYADKAKFAEAVEDGKEYRSETGANKNAILTSFLERYYRAIEDMILMARSRDVDVVLVIPPYPFFANEMGGEGSGAKSDEFYYTVFERAKQVLSSLGKTYGLLVIDADEEFRERGRTQDLFLDPVHLAAKGNYLLADIVVAKLYPYLFAI